MESVVPRRAMEQIFGTESEGEEHSSSEEQTHIGEEGDRLAGTVTAAPDSLAEVDGFRGGEDEDAGLIDVCEDEDVGLIDACVAQNEPQIFENDVEDGGPSNHEDGQQSVDVAEHGPQSNNSVDDDGIPAQGDAESIGPCTGMVYPSVDDIFNAYQRHARHLGFSISKRGTRKNRYCSMICDRGRVANNLDTKSKRIGCPAKINAKKLGNDTWVITTTHIEHNHELVPTMSILMPAHRCLSSHLKRQLECNDIAGIRTSKSIRMCEVQAGGPYNIGALPKDCRNYVEERRRMRLGDGDAEAIRQLFTRLQLLDPEFSYFIDLDDEGILRNVLWIHPRSRAAYEHFHDVVSFDTTYLVNRYQMPFGAFVGVNHHGQSILLGCALVTQEDATSFKWVFENWIAAMGGVEPGAILTDQCESIKKALSETIPNTRHRYCLWHILSKLPAKFKGLADYNRKSSLFTKIVYESLSIESFVASWAESLINNSLGNNLWLKGLYDERDKWVPVYSNHMFWAGMLSTQRSERMHAYFDDYLHSRCTLKQFMEQYEVALGKKIQKEFLADFESKYKLKRLKTAFGWEAQFRDCYTNAMYGLIQNEIEKLYYCFIVAAPGNDVVQGIEKYHVKELICRDNIIVQERLYKVEYRPHGEYLSCQCRKFEFMGIVCCHVFKVMHELRIPRINERYILHRWRKDVFRRHCTIFFEGGYPHMTEEYKKYQEVERQFQECVDAALGCTRNMAFVKEKLVDLLSQVRNLDSSVGENCSGSTVVGQSRKIGGRPIRNPKVTKTKGRPKVRCHRKHKGTASKPASTRGTRGGRRRTAATNTQPADNHASTDEDDMHTIDLNDPDPVVSTL